MGAVLVKVVNNIPSELEFIRTFSCVVQYEVGLSRMADVGVVIFTVNFASPHLNTHATQLQNRDSSNDVMPVKVILPRVNVNSFFNNVKL